MRGQCPLQLAGYDISQLPPWLCPTHREDPTWRGMPRPYNRAGQRRQL